jgi:hypothetical protein
MNLMNFKNADLTSPFQKVIAGVLGVGLLVVLYYLLPPLVLILKNLWLTAALTLPLVFLIYNYHILWSLLKQASWAMTKKIISSNKLWYMWQGYNWLVERNNDLDKSITKIGEIEVKTKKELARIAKEATATKDRAIHDEQKGVAKPVLKVLYSKVSLLEKQFNNLEPKMRFIENQRKGLIELHSNWVADTEILKQTLEAKEQEYELMKELSAASNSASAFLKRDSQEMKDFNESLKQIEQSINEYTSNIESFQRNVLPTLQTMDSQREMNEAEGQKLIEDFKKQRLLIPEDATIVSK